MRLAPLLLGMAAGLLLIAGCTAGSGGTIYEETSTTIGLPAQFSPRQGEHGWSYYTASTGSHTYQPLSWGETPVAGLPGVTGYWCAAATPGVAIAKEYFRPGANQDAVIGWRVSRAGQISVGITLRSAHPGSGEGITATLWQNTTCLSGPTQFPALAQSQAMSAMHTMAAGDTIYLRIAARGATQDWYKYQITITASAP